jgi:hypothetical protein
LACQVHFKKQRGVVLSPLNTGRLDDGQDLPL